MSKEINYLYSTKAVRERTKKLYELSLQGKTHWQVNVDQLEACADYVISTIKKKYPDLNIPFHSRMGHFRAGGVDRVAQFYKKIEHQTPLDQLKSKWDLIIISVLLDAGAGMNWTYLEKSTAQNFSKSEGLALASLELFLTGSLSSNPSKRYQVNANALKNLTEDRLKKIFQVTDQNPLVGVEGRLSLLHALGNTLEQFDRPSYLVEEILEKNKKEVYAQDVLKILLKNLSSIWPGRSEYQGVPLGDTWSHPLLGKKNTFESFVPFHKLSQWLTYSLLEPLMEYGLKLQGLNEMTGLPEYRNGGLFIDTGVLTLKGTDQNSLLHKTFKAQDLEVIEWRACTVTLLDFIAPIICKKLKKTADELPLVKILEGGTWWAGRSLASEKRKEGGPPLQIQSDGTVF